VALVVGTSGLSHAQSAEQAAMIGLESECVIELRGGTTMRAQVLEYRPGSHVNLRAFDGQTFRLPIDEVMDIRHPGDGPLPPSPACERIARAILPVDRPPATPLPAPPIAPPPVAEDPPARPVPPPAPVAPVASGPPVTLDTRDPGIELQIAEDIKRSQSFRRGRPVYSYEYVWKKVCTAPCGIPIGEEGIYRVNGEGVRATKPFRLDGLGGGPFQLKLRLGPAGMYPGGIASIVLGVLSSLGGVGLFIAGGLGSPMAPMAGAPPSYLTDYQGALQSRNTLFTIGGVMLGTGIIGTAAGVLLMRRGKSLVTVERPQRPVETNPEATAP
jgi:hypothetical protein